MRKVKKNQKIEFKITPSELRNIHKDFDFDLSNINYDDEQLSLFNKFKTKLTAPEKIILELYAEFQSQRKVASLLNVSRTTIVKELNKIRNKILYD